MVVLVEEVAEVDAIARRPAALLLGPSWSVLALVGGHYGSSSSEREHGSLGVADEPTHAPFEPTHARFLRGGMLVQEAEIDARGRSGGKSDLGRL